MGRRPRADRWRRGAEDAQREELAPQSAGSGPRRPDLPCRARAIPHAACRERARPPHPPPARAPGGDGTLLARVGQVELGLHSRALRSLRHPLERCGALVSRQVVDSADQGHVHSSELWRYDQLVPHPIAERRDPAVALGNLVVADVVAAVLAPSTSSPSGSAGGGTRRPTLCSSSSTPDVSSAWTAASSLTAEHLGETSPGATCGRGRFTSRPRSARWENLLGPRCRRASRRRLALHRARVPATSPSGAGRLFAGRHWKVRLAPRVLLKRRASSSSKRRWQARR